MRKAILAGTGMLALFDRGAAADKAGRRVPDMVDGQVTKIEGQAGKITLKSTARSRSSTWMKA